MLDQYWAPNLRPFLTPNMRVLNIDEDSSKEEKHKGRKICKKHNIIYMDREEKGMSFNAVSACNFFNADWLIWFQHDCWPITPGFFEKFDAMVVSGALDKFGAVGFNTVAADVETDYDTTIVAAKKGEKPLALIGRSGLTPYRWYTGRPIKRNAMLPKPRRWRKPSAVESIAWMAIAINVKLYQKHIIPTTDFLFFHAWDDVCYQFLAKNIYNVAIPSLYIDHRPGLKGQAGLPKSSTKVAKRGIETYHPGKWTHLKTWKNKWGWDWRNPQSFAKVAKKYRNTLLHEFFNHNFATGPLATFDVPGGSI